MPYLDDLLNRVQDSALRTALADEVAKLRERKNFGLVFERHLPERVALRELPPSVGKRVGLRRDVAGGETFVLTGIDGNELTIRGEGGDCRVVSPEEVVVLHEIGQPIYPALRPLGTLERVDGKPHHVVIEGENYHALHLLRFALQGEVDVIYIDPPYNTGATDWKYSNRFVDENDRWRHSKWLSMMERRLRLARRLLKPDGVIIVTIDANEVHHLGLLLEEVFPDALRQMVTICINPSGTSGEGLSRVEEYAYFCFFGGAQPTTTPDDFLTVEAAGGEAAANNTVSIDWESLLRRGNAWYRESRRNLCFPIVIDTALQRIVGAGQPLPVDVPDDDRPRTDGQYELAWPVRTDGRLGIWRVDAARLRWLAEQGYAYPSSRDPGRGTWTIRYLMSGTVNAIEAGTVQVVGRGPLGQVVLRTDALRQTTAKTMWHRGRHTAGGGGGTQMLTALLGRRGAFPFPKSVYAVRDCLRVAIGNRTDAVVLDFFAGSGTTLHATCLLNAEDDGTRQCVLVTNNEVDLVTASRLMADGHYPGHPEFERHGIFEAVTRPRCEAVISGRRPDGTEVSGIHLGGRLLAEGFAENASFFRLDYLDRDSIELGQQYAAIVPALWLKAGARGQLDADRPSSGPWSIPDASAYAVLFEETKIRPFRRELEHRPNIQQVYLVTDSEEAYAEMCDQLAHRWRTTMLYRDYLRNFRLTAAELQ